MAVYSIKQIKFSSIMLMVFCASLLAAQTAPTLDGLRESYAQFKDNMEAKHREQRTALDTALLARLTVAEKASTQRGDLDGVLKIRETRAALEKAVKDKEPFAPQDAKGAPEFQQALNEHRREAGALAAKQREEADALTVRYAESLDKLKRRLVMEDNINDAIAVQKEIENLPAPEPKPVPAPPPAPPPVEVAPVKPSPPIVTWDSQNDPNRPKDYKGPKKGVFTGAVIKSAEAHRLIVYDGKETWHFFPRWIGGMPDEGGGFDKAILKRIESFKEGDLVEVKWSFEDRFRALEIKVLKSAGK